MLVVPQNIVLCAPKRHIFNKCTPRLLQIPMESASLSGIPKRLIPLNRTFNAQSETYTDVEIELHPVLISSSPLEPGKQLLNFLSEMP